MGFDSDTLEGVGRGQLPSTFRFFRFEYPTLSYGRLQKRDRIQQLIPAKWDAVQRPTGGGIVFHQTDLCLSLCWPKGEAPIPTSPKEMYRWIHQLIQAGLGNSLRMAACGDTCDNQAAFDVRECFSEPVGYDLLQASKKVVGGAIYSTKNAILYQGSIQLPVSASVEQSLQHTFEKALQHNDL